MASDELTPGIRPMGATGDALAGPNSVADARADARADALARWTRAVIAVQASHEEEAQSLAPPLFTPKADTASPPDTRGLYRSSIDASSPQVPLSDSAMRGGSSRHDRRDQLDRASRQSQGGATAEPKTESGSTSVQGTSEGASAWPLSALRRLHASHRQDRFDAAALSDTPQAGRSTPQREAVGMVDMAASQVQRSPSANSGSAGTEEVRAPDGSEQLHALIESCCSRLWVSDGGGGIPQGVMLDLGRWMPGCTVEVAKAAGVLRITLRGVDDDDRAQLHEELLGLGEGLAKKLGCRVVATIAAGKELR